MVISTLDRYNPSLQNAFNNPHKI